MSLRTRMLGGLAVTLTLMLAVAVFAYVQIARVERSARLTVGESVPYAKLAQEMQLTVLRVQDTFTDSSLVKEAAGAERADGLEKVFNESLSRFQTMFRREHDDQMLKAIEEIRSLFKSYMATGRTMMDAYLNHGDKEGDKAMEAFDAASDRLVDTLEPFVKSQMSEMDGSMNEIVASSSAMKRWSAVGLALAILLSGAFYWRLTRSITLSINHIVESLSTGASEVSTAASQVSQTSSQLASCASEQAASLEETSSALEELTAATQTSASHAAQAGQLVNVTHADAQEGASTMLRLDTTMSGISESSEKVGNIIKVIQEIAFQTNLLALNAAVEAARAGEQGKGFAVVAEEVRNLAQRTAQAAEETTSLINGAITRAHDGRKVSGEFTTVLGKITHNIEQFVGLVGDISKTSNEQARGIDQISTTVADIDRTTQQNAASAEESAAAAEQLAAQALSVKSVVDDLVVLVHGKRYRLETRELNQQPH